MASKPTSAIVPDCANPFDTQLNLQVILRDDPHYGSRRDSYWAVNSRLAPSCFVLPNSPEQVSAILSALVAQKRQFAIRCGGHSPVPGTNNIADGVTIDLSLLTGVTVDTDSKTVRFGAGNTWRDVYKECTKHKSTVAGGRGGDVGVSGLLLGGGSTWMSAKNGWACDNVLSFEVVLADGRIVTADKNSNSDLYRALKGGSNNFGIVTSFTMPLLPSDRIWGGIGVTPTTAIPEVIDVTWRFTEEQPQHPDSYLMAVMSYFPALGGNVAATVVYQGEGVSDGPEFKGWHELPKVMDTTKETTIYDLSFDITLPRDYHNAWFTLCFNNDKRIMQKAAQAHQAFVNELRAYVSDGDFISQCIFQPVPTIIAEHSAAAGGNVMGIERNSGHAILFHYTAMMKTSEQAAYVYPKLQASFQVIRDYAASVENGLNSWVYSNYADKSQDVIGSYGAENISFMKQVSEKYDPGQVFQKLCPGGWKIPDSK